MTDHSSQTVVRSSRTRAQYADDGAAGAYAALHDGSLPVSRFFQSRLFAVMEVLRRSLGGDLLDAGCGPGMLVRRVLDERPGDFRIKGIDMSPAMIRAAGTIIDPAEEVELTVGRIESLPYDDATFDVVVATGVLEYVDISSALREIGRVARPGALVVTTMQNPLSPYRLYEWGLYWPLLRALGKAEAALGRPPARRHGAVRTGIHAVPAARLCRMMRAHRLVPTDVVGYDLNLLLPPVDKVVRRRHDGWRERPWTTSSRGPKRMLGTAYLVCAHRL